VTHLGFVIAAAVVGAVGNEVVAQYRIRVGRRIGSAALEADGIHARTDGVTSLLVLIGAIAVTLGWHWADPVVGLLITAAVLIVGYQAVRSVEQRLLDAVDPEIVERITKSVAAVDGVASDLPLRALTCGLTLRCLAPFCLVFRPLTDTDGRSLCASLVHPRPFHEMRWFEDHQKALVAFTGLVALDVVRR